MIFIASLLFFLSGMAVSAAIFCFIIPGRFRQHIDYRQRWRDAVGLLGAQGQLTGEQVALITSGGQPVPSPRVMPEPGPHDCANAAVMPVLHGMASWDRRDAEIIRAEKGLPPVDDLRGMPSWDVRDVLVARANGERRKRS